MSKQELMDFLEWYAGDETPNAERSKELEAIADIYLNKNICTNISTKNCLEGDLDCKHCINNSNHV